MDLFNTSSNLLPFDGEANYHPNVISLASAQEYFQKLLSLVAWKNDVVVLFGKRIVTNRKVAWYGDSDFIYSYANTNKKALPWIPELLALKQIAETTCNATFNACLLNLYHNGNESMGWHSDDETELGKNPTIASLSLGADRIFSLKHRENKQTVSVVLEKGSIVVMKGETQDYWLHKIPTNTRITMPRISLTFRKIVS